ncbi:hypothetical protein F4556_006180 [Kitasatospora gansuensis]|uniref:Mce-associated membrane protein n=1 Tax=Kitasatospora gansuensis TaxID=258050 RepID=A0A7W7SHM1_9ACTN|nr:hypothetical protein [Kitasatospora gansuensis]MBB4950645.1 hypothetical protein [Kitasatospora gansuensis]
MSSTTTRHLINRQRRLAAARPPAAPLPVVRPPRRRRLPAVLLALTVLLGGFATWSALAAADLRADAGQHNTALTDPAATSEVKGRITEAVNALFSFTHADPARTDQAAQRLLTGRAVEQHATLLAQVRAQAAAKKLLLTTTVTDAAVAALDGDRARLLIFADQRNTSTADGAKDAASYSAAMFAVDAVRTDGSWRIENIDTYGR